MNFYVFRRVFFSCLSLSLRMHLFFWSISVVYHMICVPFICHCSPSLDDSTGKKQWLYVPWPLPLSTNHGWYVPWLLPLSISHGSVYLDHHRCLSAMVICTLTITVVYRPWLKCTLTITVVYQPWLKCTLTITVVYRPWSYVPWPLPLPLSISHGYLSTDWTTRETRFQKKKNIALSNMTKCV